MALIPNDPASSRHALLLVSFAILTGSCPWLVGSAIGPALATSWEIDPTALAPLTIAVQLGFVAGTFAYALTSLSDVFDPRRVLVVSALSAALANAGFAWFADDVSSALPFRFLTGFLLAGVYPVGMKIVASWFPGRLGAELGVMVGALTLGTALPWLLRGVLVEQPWQRTVLVSSAVSASGALLLALRLPRAPFDPPRARFDPRRMFRVFGHPPFRWTALGYFGHMWELYAVWTWIGTALAARGVRGLDETRVPFVVFGFVGLGAVGCVLGGRWSRSRGERFVAHRSLLTSAACCLLYAWLPSTGWLLLPLLAVWGASVVSDSPQFSALAARFAPDDSRGTALTVQNGIGFALSVISIHALPWLAEIVGWRVCFVALAPGPLFGAYAMARLRRLMDSDRGP